MIHQDENFTIPNQIDISNFKDGLFIYQFESNDNQQYNSRFTVLK